MNLAFLALTKPGDRAIMQSPYFHPILTIMDTRGCQPVYNPLILKDGRYELDFEDFERKIKETRPSVFVLINPHNPTGRVFTKEELIRLVDICAAYNVKIISDDVHFNYTYDGHKYILIASVSGKAEEITVTLMAASKGYNIMDLTFATIIAANPKIKRLLDERDAAFCYYFAANQFGVAALMGAYSEESDPWVKEVQAYLEENLNYLDHFFKENISRIKAAFNFTADDNCFKCYLFDTGLLVSLAYKDTDYLDNELYGYILADKLQTNEGMLIENMIAQCLKAGGHQAFYYRDQDEKQKKSYEVDFVIRKRKKIQVIEAKSSGSSSIKSLKRVQKLYGKSIVELIVLHSGDIKKVAKKLMMRESCTIRIMLHQFFK